MDYVNGLLALAAMLLIVALMADIVVDNFTR